jgi:hypothetical protein
MGLLMKNLFVILTMVCLRGVGSASIEDECKVLSGLTKDDFIIALGDHRLLD